MVEYVNESYLLNSSPLFTHIIENHKHFIFPFLSQIYNRDILVLNLHLLRVFLSVKYFCIAMILVILIIIQQVTCNAYFL